MRFYGGTQPSSCASGMRHPTATSVKTTSGVSTQLKSQPIGPMSQTHRRLQYAVGVLNNSRVRLSGHRH